MRMACPPFEHATVSQHGAGVNWWFPDIWFPNIEKSKPGNLLKERGGLFKPMGTTCLGRTTRIMNAGS
jgi:hypothetical protein